MPEEDAPDPQLSLRPVKEQRGGDQARSASPEESQQASPASRNGESPPSQEFFLAVHGLVRLRAEEVAVVNHPAFQRLGEIYQLGQTHLVYRSATHKRFEHALGALHVVQLMIDAVQQNSGPEFPDPGDTVGGWSLGRPLNDSEVAFARLGALLHDIGHLAAGHTLEDELGLLGSHDADQRICLILDRKNWRGVQHDRTLRGLVDESYTRAAKAAGLRLRGNQVVLTPSEVLLALVSKDWQGRDIESHHGFRLGVCRDLIGNTICADLLDYLHRDWLHIGKPRYFDLRLLDYMEIRTRERPGITRSELVVNLRGGSAVRTDGVTAILDLLESRYQLSEIALFHRTKLCAAAMLERSIAELGESLGGGKRTFFENLPERLLDCSDDEMLSVLLQEAKDAAAKAGKDEGRKSQATGAVRLLQRLRLRQLHKHFISAFEYKLADNARAVQDRYSGPETEADPAKRAQIGAENRLKAMRLLERDFGLPPGSLVMYCPPRKMNTKIAEVCVLVHGDVHTLDAFEADHGDRGVTGGHLEAQKQRFRRLWRIMVAIDSEQRERLRASDLLDALGRAVDLCVLGTAPLTGSLDEAVRSLARELTGRPGTPLSGRHLIDRVAARQAGLRYYPGGSSSLLDCTER